MSGQREQWDGLEQPDQPDPLDSTLIMARLFGRSVPDHANGYGNGNGNGNRERERNGARVSAAPGTGTGVAPAPLSYLAPDTTTGRHRTTRTVQDGPGDPGPEPVRPPAELAPTARSLPATPSRPRCPSRRHARQPRSARAGRAARAAQHGLPHAPSTGLSRKPPQRSRAHETGHRHPEPGRLDQPAGRRARWHSRRTRDWPSRPERQPERPPDRQRPPRPDQHRHRPAQAEQAARPEHSPGRAGKPARSQRQAAQPEQAAAEAGQPERAEVPDDRQPPTPPGRASWPISPHRGRNPEHGPTSGSVWNACRTAIRPRPITSTASGNRHRRG